MSLLEVLKKLVGKYPSITNIRLHYQGEGDSGYVDEIMCFDSEGKSVDCYDDDHYEDWQESLKGWVYDNLPGGWELNEGSYGHVDIDPVIGKAVFSHTEKTEQSEEFYGQVE